jgi:hypothetical protein
VDMVLCVAVGHVASLGAVMLQHGKVCRHLRGSYSLLQTLPRASAPGLGSFAPPGLECVREMQ